jgi:methylenetetrahydrofolate dehydrogenase (NADP+)/methenyltetrahydrofolate cyclohydrolase
MTAVVLDGRKLAVEVRAGRRERVSGFKDKFGVAPGLASVIVGDDSASRMYVSMKQKACSEAGINSMKRELPAEASVEELIGVVDALNNDDSVHGILVQLPLPRQINTQRILSLINPLKDVDGFSPVNQGRLAAGDEFMVAATPLGVIRLLDEYGIKVKGMDAVIVNHSIVLGRPLAMLLLNRNATVTVCHVDTRDLKSHTVKADLLVSGTGVAGLIKADMVKDGVVVVDVGISRKKGRTVGDVDYEKVKEKASYITPVPGGTGPMTVAMLLDNTVKAAEHILSLS